MKRLLLLPTLLLAACSTTPPTAPFKVGDVVQIEGTSKTGQKIAQKYALKREGTYADGEWRYTVMELADALTIGQLQVHGGSDKYIVLEVTTFNAKSKDSQAMKTLCLAYPTDQYYSESAGFLVYDTLDNARELEKKIDQTTTEAGVRELLANSGTCTITRQ